jgi:mitogen-activated protein kinase kinase kinase ANP1
MSEPFDNWESKFDISPDQNSNQSTEFGGLARHAESSITENDFTFPCAGSYEDDDVTNIEEKLLLSLATTTMKAVI